MDVWEAQKIVVVACSLLHLPLLVTGVGRKKGKKEGGERGGGKAGWGCGHLLPEGIGGRSLRSNRLARI